MLTPLIFRTFLRGMRKKLFFLKGKGNGLYPVLGLHCFLLRGLSQLTLYIGG